MKRLSFCLALVALLALAGQAAAVPGTIDDHPAATLLLPCFEVSPIDVYLTGYAGPQLIAPSPAPRSSLGAGRI